MPNSRPRKRQGFCVQVVFFPHNKDVIGRVARDKKKQPSASSGSLLFYPASLPDAFSGKKTFFFCARILPFLAGYSSTKSEVLNA